jgi:hypothetical protein
VKRNDYKGKTKQIINVSGFRLLLLGKKEDTYAAADASNSIMYIIQSVYIACKCVEKIRIEKKRQL